MTELRKEIQTNLGVGYDDFFYCIDFHFLVRMRIFSPVKTVIYFQFIPGQVIPFYPLFLPKINVSPLAYNRPNDSFPTDEYDNGVIQVYNSITTLLHKLSNVMLFV